MKTEKLINTIAYLVVTFIAFCLVAILIEVAKNPDCITFGHF